MLLIKLLTVDPRARLLARLTTHLAASCYTLLGPLNPESARLRYSVFCGSNLQRRSIESRNVLLQISSPRLWMRALIAGTDFLNALFAVSWPCSCTNVSQNREAATKKGKSWPTSTGLWLTVIHESATEDEASTHDFNAEHNPTLSC